MYDCPHVPSHATAKRDVVMVCVKVLVVSNATLVRRNVSGIVNIILVLSNVMNCLIVHDALIHVLINFQGVFILAVVLLGAGLVILTDCG